MWTLTQYKFSYLRRFRRRDSPDLNESTCAKQQHVSIISAFHALIRGKLLQIQCPKAALLQPMSCIQRVHVDKLTFSWMSQQPP